MIADLIHNWNPLHLLDNWRAIRRYGLGVRFVLPVGANAAALRKLRRYGIRTYCYGIRGDLRTFRVRRAQAEWARYLLAGGNPARAWSDANPRAAARSVGWMGAILDIFMRR